MAKKCPVCDKQLVPMLTTQGIEVDVCQQCEGVWLDKDEIFLFTKEPDLVLEKFSDALAKKKLTDRKSPISNVEMVELPLFDGQINIDYCMQSGGLWLDKGEIDKFPQTKLELTIDRGTMIESVVQDQITEDMAINPFLLNPQLAPLPNLTLSSTSVLVGLYAVLSFVLIFASQFIGLSAGGALLIALLIVLIQFAIGPFFMDMSLKWLYRIQWVEPQGLPDHLREFIMRVCSEKSIKIPRIGIIMDGSPQAFTYGHHPNNGRVVISQGLMDLLDEEEVEAVVAHEIGHIVHWDMVVMTAAQLVPLVLYYIYRSLIRIRLKGKEDKTAAIRYVIAIGAYMLYAVSEYVILWFSRIREYYADRFAGLVTEKPEKLASALVKIGYGLAGRRSSRIKNNDDQASVASRGLEPLGIFNARHAKMLAISAKSGAEKMGGEIDKEILKDVAKWDLWNPWAGYYELHSTHPLIAKRIQKLSNLSYYLGKKPYIEFNERKPESYWDDFIIDVFMHFFPTIILIVGFLHYTFKIVNLAKQGAFEAGYTMSASSLAFLVFFLGLSFLFKIFYSYPNKGFVPINIRALLKKIRVSAVNPVPCRLRGKIIGRGVPGLIYSEDFVMQDETGIMFLDYRQPLAIFNFLFGLLRAKNYKLQDAEVVGWYRRSPVPYIEIKELRVDGKVERCYVYNFKLYGSIALMVIGIFLLFL